MPPAAAYRPSGRRIRAEMLRRGAIRAVIALPPGAAQPRNIGLHLWVLTRPSSDTTHYLSTLFIDGATEASHTGDGRGLPGRPQQASDILRAWTAFAVDANAGEHGTWREVPVIDLLDEAVDLTPARHVIATLARQPASEITTTAGAARARLHGIVDGLGEGLPGRDWTPADAAPGWRMVSVGDLARSGAISIHRASNAAPTVHEPADPPASGDRWLVLTASNVADGEAPSAAAPDTAIEPDWVKIRPGDVIIPAAADGPVTARVATGEDEEAILGRGLHLIRAESERINPWFLAGFIASPANIQQASYGSMVTRIDVRRLTVPLLPLSEQSRYGTAFRELHRFRVSCEEFARLSETLSRLLARALAEGGLLPGPGGQSQSRKPGGEAERLDTDDISRNGKRRP